MALHLHTSRFSPTSIQAFNFANLSYSDIILPPMANSQLKLIVNVISMVKLYFYQGLATNLNNIKNEKLNKLNYHNNLSYKF